jgi:carboxymethylenebutenolidase
LKKEQFRLDDKFHGNEGKQLNSEIIVEHLKGTSGIPAIIAKPPTGSSFPCVIILHERYGLVQHTIDLAKKLAGSGYVVAAPDLFFEYQDKESLHKGNVSVQPSDTEVLSHLEDVVNLLSMIPEADPSRLGMIGVCQTGRYSFLFGAHHSLQACITIYGAAQARDWVDNEKQKSLETLIDQMNSPVLGIFGEKDHVISIMDVKRLRNTLEQYDKSYEISIYGEAPHGWMNDTMPGRYRRELAEIAWQQMLDFLAVTTSPDFNGSYVQWKFNSVKNGDYDFTKNVRLE